MSEIEKSKQLPFAEQGPPVQQGYCPQWLYDEVYLGLHHLYRLQLIDRPKTTAELADTIEGFSAQVAAGRVWNEALDLAAVRETFRALGDNTWWPAPKHFLVETEKRVGPAKSGSLDHQPGERMLLEGLALEIRETLNRIPSSKARLRFLSQVFWAPKQVHAPLKGPNRITAQKIVDGWNHMLEITEPEP